MQLYQPGLGRELSPQLRRLLLVVAATRVVHCIMEPHGLCTLKPRRPQDWLVTHATAGDTGSEKAVADWNMAHRCLRGNRRWWRRLQLYT